MQPRVAVAILAMKNPELLAESLDSIERHRAGQPPHQVVLVLNEASDEVREVARTRAPGAVIIDSPVNLGTGGGFNRAFAATNAEFMAIAHDDSQVTANWLSPLVERMDAEPSLGAVGGATEDFDGELQVMGGIIFRDGTTCREWEDDAGAVALQGDVRDVDYHGGLGLLIRREAWSAIGGFDDVAFYPGYYSDADFCLRLRGAGWRVQYVPGSILRHHQSRSTTPELRSFVAMRNREVFARRHARELATHGEWSGSGTRCISAELERVRRTAIPRREPIRGLDAAAATPLERRLNRTDSEYLRCDRDVMRGFAAAQASLRDELREMDVRRRSWQSVARMVGDDRDRWHARAADQAAHIERLFAQLHETGQALKRTTAALEQLVRSRWWRAGERLRRLRP